MARSQETSTRPRSQIQMVISVLCVVLCVLAECATAQQATFNYDLFALTSCEGAPTATLSMSSCLTLGRGSLLYSALKNAQGLILNQYNAVTSPAAFWGFTMDCTQTPPVFKYMAMDSLTCPANPTFTSVATESACLTLLNLNVGLSSSIRISCPPRPDQPTKNPTSVPSGVPTTTGPSNAPTKITASPSSPTTMRPSNAPTKTTASPSSPTTVHPTLSSNSPTMPTAAPISSTKTPTTVTPVTATPTATPTLRSATSNPTPVTATPTATPTLRSATSNPTMNPSTGIPSSPAASLFLSRNCRPQAKIAQKNCKQRVRNCRSYGAVMKWAGKGCRSQTKKLMNDGGCRCKGYCNYSCESSCRLDPECFWRADMGKCVQFLTGLPTPATDKCW